MSGTWPPSSVTPPRPVPKRSIRDVADDAIAWVRRRVNTRQREVLEDVRGTQVLVDMLEDLKAAGGDLQHSIGTFTAKVSAVEFKLTTFGARMSVLEQQQTALDLRVTALERR